MTTFRRKFRRAHYQRLGKKWPSSEQPFTINADGGYSTTHPTKGRRKVSARRLRARALLTKINQAIIERRLGVSFA